MFPARTDEGVVPLSYVEGSTGKSLDVSKVRYSWTLSLDRVAYLIDFTNSKTSGMKRVFVNGQLQHEQQVYRSPQFQYSWPLGGHLLSIVPRETKQKMDLVDQMWEKTVGKVDCAFELCINGLPFYAFDPRAASAFQAQSKSWTAPEAASRPSVPFRNLRPSPNAAAEHKRERERALRQKNAEEARRRRQDSSTPWSNPWQDLKNAAVGQTPRPSTTSTTTAASTSTYASSARGSWGSGIVGGGAAATREAAREAAAAAAAARSAASLPPERRRGAGRRAAAGRGGHQTAGATRRSASPPAEMGTDRWRASPDYLRTSLLQDDSDSDQSDFSRHTGFETINSESSRRGTTVGSASAAAPACNSTGCGGPAGNSAGPVSNAARGRTADAGSKNMASSWAGPAKPYESSEVHVFASATSHAPTAAPSARGTTASTNGGYSVAETGASERAPQTARSTPTTAATGVVASAGQAPAKDDDIWAVLFPDGSSAASASPWPGSPPLASGSQASTPAGWPSAVGSRAQVPPNGPEPSLGEAVSASGIKIREQADELRPGMVVRLQGLKQAAELNGQDGVVEQEVLISGRWRVRLRSGVKKDLRAENLVVDDRPPMASRSSKSKEEASTGLGQQPAPWAAEAVEGILWQQDEDTLHEQHAILASLQSSRPTHPLASTEEGGEGRSVEEAPRLPIPAIDSGKALAIDRSSSTTASHFPGPSLAWPGPRDVEPQTVATASASIWEWPAEKGSSLAAASPKASPPWPAETADANVLATSANNSQPADASKAASDPWSMAWGAATWPPQAVAPASAAVTPAPVSTWGEFTWPPPAPASSPPGAKDTTSGAAVWPFGDTSSSAVCSSLPGSSPSPKAAPLVSHVAAAVWPPPLDASGTAAAAEAPALRPHTTAVSWQQPLAGAPAAGDSSSAAAVWPPPLDASPSPRSPSASALWGLFPEEPSGDRQSTKTDAWAT